MLLHPRINFNDPIGTHSRYSLFQANIAPALVAAAAPAASSGAVLGGAAIAAGGSLLGGVLGGKSKGTKIRPTLDIKQQALRNLLIGNMLGIDPSIIAGRKGNLRSLVQSGELDDILDFSSEGSKVNEFIFQGDRVADLTSAQKDIISGALGTDTRQSDVRSQFGDIRSRRDLAPQRLTEQQTISSPFEEAQIVGEDGPEVISPTEDVTVIPAEESETLLGSLGRQRDARKALLLNRSQQTTANKELAQARRSDRNAKVLAKKEARLAEFSPLAQESDTVGANPAELLEETGLPGFQAGGNVDENQQAVVGENGPEVLVPNDQSQFSPLSQQNAQSEFQQVKEESLPGAAVQGQATNPLAGSIQSASQRALSGTPSSQINEATTTNLIQKSVKLSHSLTMQTSGRSLYIKHLLSFKFKHTPLTCSKPLSSKNSVGIKSSILQQSPHSVQPLQLIQRRTQT